MRNHDSINNNKSSIAKRRAAVASLATVAAIGLGASVVSSDGKTAKDTRYPAPPAADTLRLQHIAEPGDNPTLIAEKIADDYNQSTAGQSGHLTTHEVLPHLYSAGGKTPEGHPIPSDDEIINIGEHTVADIPVEKVFDNQ